MALFGIYIPQHDHITEPTEGLVKVYAEAIAVNDKFSLFAFIAPYIWMMYKRLWLPLLMLFGLQVVLFSLGYMLFGTENAVGFHMVLSFLIALYIGFEAHKIEGFSLKQKGFQQAALLIAQDHQEAIYRYFDHVSNIHKPEKETSSSQ